MNLQDREDWKSRVRSFVLDEVRNRVMAANSAPEGLEQMWQDWERPEVLEIFEKAFVHKSVAPNESDNYELLDFMGDRQLKFSFAEYAQRRFPGITVSELSELDSAVMSKIRQAELSEKMGLHLLLLAADDSVGRDIDVREDLFESLFGAVTVAGDNLFQGNGSAFAANLLTQIMLNEEIDFSLSMGNAITQVKEVLEILPGGHQVTLESLETAYKTTDGRWNYTLNLPPTVISTMRESIQNRMRNFWRALGNSQEIVPTKLQIEDLIEQHPEIASTPQATALLRYADQLENLPTRGIKVEAVANLKDEARNNAYKSMQRAISKIVDLPDLLRYSRGVEISDPNLRRQVAGKLDQLGFDIVQSRFFGDKFDFYQLVGVRFLQGGIPRYEVLHTMLRPEGNLTHEQATEMMLRQFVDK